jgi:hypothetical protein
MADGDYCSLAELKARIWPIGTTSDTVEDEILEAIITSVSRTIDNYCGRRFYVSTADETRYFETDDPEYLFPGVDIKTVTTIKTDADGDRTYENTWDTDDFDLYPENAALDNQPYTWIRTAVNGSYSFPSIPRAVEIVGTFGYCVTGSEPAVVSEAVCSRRTASGDAGKRRSG